MNYNDKAVVDVTLRLTLRRGFWSDPDKWLWTELLDLDPSEDVEVIAYKGVRRIFADGSVMEARA